ncbi:MAG: NADH-quinone oxidoreductase subunit C [Gammaproteobacteria bacterium]|nr:NADH-quinone oxidoreductase subunit C [Gammaproteobacteria bacterium]
MNSEIEPRLDKLLAGMDDVRVKLIRPRRIRIDVPSESLPTLLELLQGKASYVHLSAISCVDWIDNGEFELVYHVWSYESQSLVSAHTRIPRDPGVYLSIYDLYQPAAFFERDIHEMYGVFFEGSPDMEKFILTEWDGPPPMRKEFNSEEFVNQNFTWEEYRPEWLEEIEAEGGGIVKPASHARR